MSDRKHGGAYANCPHCGFAMTRGLDRVCPRCGNSPDALPAAGASAAPQASADATPGAPAAPGWPPTGPAPISSEPREEAGSGERQGWTRQKAVGATAGGLAFIVAFNLMYALTTGGFGPQRQARIAYRQAVQKMRDKDFQGAVALCKKALEHEPKMAEASAIAGMATLGIYDEKPNPELWRELAGKAQGGDTAALDTCDAWMRDCIKRCDQAPDRRPADRTVGTTRHCKAMAQMSLSLTALVRTAAALQMGNVTLANAWLGQMDKLLKEAEATEPGEKNLKDVRQAHGQMGIQLALKVEELQRKAAEAKERAQTPAPSRQSREAAALGSWFREQRQKQEDLRAMMRPQR